MSHVIFADVYYNGSYYSGNHNDSLGSDDHGHDGVLFSPHPHVLVLVVLSCIILAAVIGNILVIASVYSQRRLRTVTNYYIVSLAWADFLVALFVMPFHVVGEITGRWWLGVVFCNIWISLDVLLCTASILNLCCISLDRYFAITEPLKYAAKRSKRLCFSMIAGVWIASALITSPPIFGWKDPDHGRDPTRCQLTQAPGYVIYSACGSFYFPLLVMIFVYCRIFQAASKSEKKFGLRRKFNNGQKNTTTTLEKSDSFDSQYSFSSEEKQKGNILLKPEKVKTLKLISRSSLTNEHKVKTTLIYGTPMLNRRVSKVKLQGSQNGIVEYHSCQSTPTLPRECGHTPLRSSSVAMLRLKKLVTESPVSAVCNSPTRRGKSGKSDERKKARMLLRKERKVAKTLAIVVGCFTVCWLPFFLVYIIAPFCRQCHVPTMLTSSFVWLGYLNSALNPIIYAFFNVDFRRTFWMLTFGSCKHCTPSCVEKEKGMSYNV
ncbi:putative G-protein coupled receptor No18 [Saccoglossus kowalevskii]|uniref:Tyramine receptor 2-like n=1 Tax=Saccoglossus kowalevskii TaxID=10224 RepID=A0ABM0LZ08_SACKO|nr:PREDICTED: putative tyramine receptor 2-like [Saccoglossus kowalevskii]